MRPGSIRWEIRVSVRQVCFTLFLCVGAIVPAALGQADIWLGGTGNWNDPSKWSAGVPTSTSDVFINNGNGPASVTLFGGYQCHNLNIDADAILTISGQPGFSHLDVFGTSVSNAGHIVVDDTNGDAWLGFAVGQSASLSGGGMVTLNDVTGAAAAFISGDASGATLTNVNNTIQGSGQLGFGNGLIFVNQATGVVNANQTGRTLYINPFNGTANQGLMEATGGGSMTFVQGVIVNNSGGTISSNGGGSKVVLIDITQGGTLKTSAGGVMLGEGTLDGSTHGTLNNQGTVSVPGGNTTTLLGTINNTGTIVLDDTRGDSSLSVPTGQNVTLTGAGKVLMNDTTGAAATFIGGGAGGATLTNVNNTIQGAGQLGFGNGLMLVNQAGGVINANQSHVLYINPYPGVINQGLMEATSGGSLTFVQGVTVNNSGGSISSSGSASTVVLIDVTQGGTLKTSGGGVMQGEGTLDGSTHGTLNNQGTVSVPGGNNTTLIGTINNSGAMVLDDSNGDSSLTITGNMTLTGAGTVMMNDPTGAAASFIAGGAGTILTNVNNKIQGSGQIGQAGGLGLVNQKRGIINANQSHPLYLNLPAGMVNQGLIEASGGSALVINTMVSNFGTFSVAKGALFQITSTFINFAGTTLTRGIYNVAGTLQFTGANIATNAASITLTGPSSAILDLSNNDGLRNLVTTTKGGAFSVLSGRNLTTPGAYSNAGKLTVGSSSNFTTTTSYTQTAGTTTVDGTLTAPSGTTIQAGSVFGKGTIASTVVSSGSVTSGDSLTAPGKISPSTYTQNAKGVLNTPINSATAFGQLAASNGTSLSGTLNIKRKTSYVPAIGSTFAIMTHSALTGKFSTVNGLSINSGEHFAIAYNPTNVTLTVESGP